MNEQQVERLAEIASQARLLLGHIARIEEMLNHINEGWFSTLCVQPSNCANTNSVSVPKHEAEAVLNRMLAGARSKLDKLKVDA